jgi:hypothetical protein
MVILVETVVDLTPGQEWYSGRFTLHPGRTLHEYGVGTVRFYMDVVPTVRFDQLRGANTRQPNQPWPFVPGSDRPVVERSVPVNVGGEFVAVVRLGIFRSAGRVRVSISED